MLLCTSITDMLPLLISARLRASTVYSYLLLECGWRLFVCSFPGGAACAHSSLPS